MTSAEFKNIFNNNSSSIRESGFQIEYFDQCIIGKKKRSDRDRIFTISWSEYDSIRLSQPDYGIKFNDFENTLYKAINRHISNDFTIRRSWNEWNDSEEDFDLNTDGEVLKFVSSLNDFLRDSEQYFYNKFDNYKTIHEYAVSLDGNKLRQFINHSGNNMLCRMLLLKWFVDNEEFENYYNGCLKDLEDVKNENVWSKILNDLKTIRIYLINN